VQFKEVDVGAPGLPKKAEPSAEKPSHEGQETHPSAVDKLAG
jgi:hypothetical protein